VFHMLDFRGRHSAISQAHRWAPYRVRPGQHTSASIRRRSLLSAAKRLRRWTGECKYGARLSARQDALGIAARRRDRAPFSSGRGDCLGGRPELVWRLGEASIEPAEVRVDDRTWPRLVRGLSFWWTVRPFFLAFNQHHKCPASVGFFVLLRRDRPHFRRRRIQIGGKASTVGASPSDNTPALLRRGSSFVWPAFARARREERPCER
jgi:hypothetical protein